MRIVICAAGLGSRLGLDMPKCLVEVGGKSILRRQLEILIKLATEIVVVVGFKKELVLQELEDFPVATAENNHYATTSVVDSIKVGKAGAKGEIVVIDGDVLFVHEEMEKLLNTPSNVVCIKKNLSDDSPVYVTTDGDNIVAFHRDDRGTNLEWAGICKVPAHCFDVPDGYVYQALERNLPMPYQVINSVEIDTPEDLLEAHKWIKR